MRLTCRGAGSAKPGLRGYSADLPRLHSTVLFLNVLVGCGESPHRCRRKSRFIPAFVLRQGTKNPAREKPQAGFVDLDTPLKRGTQIILFFQFSPSRS